MKRSAPILLVTAITAAMIILGCCGTIGSGEAALLRYWEKHPASPLDYVVAKFASHKWVFLGEFHRIKHDVDLVASLIPAPSRDRIDCD